MKEAYLYEKIKDDKVRCNLCSHFCNIGKEKLGICGVRKNIGGNLYSLVYRKLISENADPIEKKPLFHFLPGTLSLSIATMGCNLKCFFCQNYSISQISSEDEIRGQDVPPQDLVKHAIDNDCKSISYTYTEPTIFFEYAYDTAKIASENGLKNVFVTNGFMSKESLDMINPYLDAANVDLKAFTDNFYKKRVAGRLKPVLENIKYMKELGIWIEITTLVIPGLNDSKEELTEIAEFIKDTGEEIPWHLSAYYPQYRSSIPPTSVSKIEEAVEIGKKAGLKYVYGGNVYSNDLETTYCSNCGEPLIKRSGFSIARNEVVNGRCPKCNKEIDGIFN